MPRRRLLLRLLLSLAVGIAVGGLSLLGRGGAHPAAERADCFTRLRLIRHAIAAYEAQYGRLPAAGVPLVEVPSALAAALTMPRDASGAPDPHGPYPGLLDEVPVNPLTGSSAFAAVPAGVDAVAFAATSRDGWVYLTSDGEDPRGALPAGLVLPCGAGAGTGPGSAQALAFQIEDYQPWR